MVMRALDKDPSRRFASTTDFAVASGSGFERKAESQKPIGRVTKIAATDLRIPKYIGPRSPTGSVTSGSLWQTLGLSSRRPSRRIAHVSASSLSRLGERRALYAKPRPREAVKKFRMAGESACQFASTRIFSQLPGKRIFSEILGFTAVI